MAEKLDLSSLKPAAARKDRKRVGRGLGSGKGRYSGRGLKGQKARAGSHKMRAGFEGGQMPVYMRMGKQRGPTSKDAMPMGPFRTQTQPVNVRDLERFDPGTEISPDQLVAAGVLKSTRIDVKILGLGELTKKLVVSAHGFSATAKAKIEQAGGSVVWLRGEPKPKRARTRAARPAAPAEPEREEPQAEEPEAPAET